MVSGLTYSCPECGGVLREVQEGGIERFRCRVVMSIPRKACWQARGLRSRRHGGPAIRILEEQGEFADRLTASSKKKQQPRLAKRFSEKAHASRENASVLRDLLAEDSRPSLRNS